MLDIQITPKIDHEKENRAKQKQKNEEIVKFVY